MEHKVNKAHVEGKAEDKNNGFAQPKNQKNCQQTSTTDLLTTDRFKLIEPDYKQEQMESKEFPSSTTTNDVGPQTTQAPTNLTTQTRPSEC